MFFPVAIAVIRIKPHHHESHKSAGNLDNVPTSSHLLQEHRPFPIAKSPDLSMHATDSRRPPPAIWPIGSYHNLTKDQRVCGEDILSAWMAQQDKKPNHPSRDDIRRVGIVRLTEESIPHWLTRCTAPLGLRLPFSRRIHMGHIPPHRQVRHPDHPRPPPPQIPARPDRPLHAGPAVLQVHHPQDTQGQARQTRRLQPPQGPARLPPAAHRPPHGGH